MSEHAAELRKRYVRAYNEYFNDIPDARLLAMIINPLLATHGFDEIEFLLDDQDAAEALKERAKKLLKDRLMKYRPPTGEKEVESEDEDASTEGEWYHKLLIYFPCVICINFLCYLYSCRRSRGGENCNSFTP